MTISCCTDSSLLNRFEQMPDLLHPFLTHLIFQKWARGIRVSLASITLSQKLTGLEQGSSDSVQPFTRLCIISAAPEGEKPANPADGEDSRKIRPNTRSAHLGQSIMKQPADRPQRAHVRHQSQVPEGSSRQTETRNSPTRVSPTNLL